MKASFSTYATVSRFHLTLIIVGIVPGMLCNQYSRNSLKSNFYFYLFAFLFILCQAHSDSAHNAV
ncbi:Uncharacterised protein [Candidatus Venteria ishoeyi]|uniref:Uncharacterized protein n=1 Tax=Candidatus Venteria ishoeyi TaxID=1899563 RepID=A0A1H6F9W8_9GAMM|nr:Uncharacterised protein [Candidatus Venteria ishoeyi]